MNTAAKNNNKAKANNNKAKANNNKAKATGAADNKAKATGAADNKAKATGAADNKAKGDNNKAKADNNKAKATGAADNNANANNNNAKADNNKAKANINKQKSEIEDLKELKKLLDEGQQGLNNLSADIENTQDAEIIEQPFLKRHQRLFIGIAVIILIILCYFLGKYLYRRFFKKNKTETQKLHIEHISSQSTDTIMNDNITPPRNGYDYSVSFWFYIDDFYDNFGVWRHIMHKGSYNGTDVLNFEDWNTLSANIREQQPGLWVHPDKPVVRFAVTIHPDKEYCGIFNTSTKCEGEGRYYCEWDGFNCETKRKHPGDLYRDKKIEYINTKAGDNIIQYVDVDVPVNELVHIAYVFNQKELNVFVNGELNSVAKFMGEPVSNKLDLQLGLKNQFNGQLFDFNYFPDSISIEKVAELYKNLPIVDEVPKKKRFMKSLENGNIVGALSTLFK